VLSIDEKSQIQALDRRNTRCRCNPGRPRNALMTTCGAASPNAALWAAMGGRRGDRCALRAADLDRLPLPCCDQLVHGAAAHPELSVASAAVAMSGFMIVFLSCLVTFPGRRESNTPLRVLSCSKVGPWSTNRRQWVLRQQALPRSAWWWEVVSPAWSFWRWILWAGDLKGLE
jgi:hypothetical protein